LAYVNKLVVGVERALKAVKGKFAFVLYAHSSVKFTALEVAKSCGDMLQGASDRTSICFARYP
jgi:hypothetical protein